MCFKYWTWTQRKSVVFLPLKAAHEEIRKNGLCSKCQFSGASKVSGRSYEIFCCLIDACLVSTEVNSTKIQGLFPLSGKAVNKFSISRSCVAGIILRLQKTLEWHLEEL